MKYTVDSPWLARRKQTRTLPGAVIALLRMRRYARRTLKPADQVIRIKKNGRVIVSVWVYG